jgi:hypothetical protein
MKADIATAESVFIIGSIAVVPSPLWLVINDDSRFGSLENLA